MRMVATKLVNFLHFGGRMVLTQGLPNFSIISTEISNRLAIFLEYAQMEL